MLNDAQLNQRILRDEMFNFNNVHHPYYPTSYMSGLVPDEGRFVGMGDVRQSQLDARERLANIYRFRFRGRAKRARTLGKRKRN